MKTAASNPLAGIRTNCLGEYKNEKYNETAIFYVEYSNGFILIGTICNVGIISYCQVEYDADFSVDENLAACDEELNKNGWYNF